MTTDTGADSEYADVTIDGQSFGRCNPGYPDRDCRWYTCSLSKSQLTTSSSNIPIQLQYSGSVCGTSCTYNGLTGTGVARITFTTN